MARKYKKKNNRRNKRVYTPNDKNQTYKKFLSKLADKKINTLYEKRAKEIAEGQRIKMISRRYFSTVNDIGAPYNQVFGLEPNDQVEPHSNNWNYTRFQHVSTEPIVYTLTAIGVTDINQPLNQAINPNDQDGVAQGMTTQDQHGKRHGKFCNITGISLDIRAIHDLGYTELANNQIGQVVLRKIMIESMARAVLYWKVIAVPIDSYLGVGPLQTEEDKQAPAIASVQSELNAWGFSHALDYKTSEHNNTRKRRYKVLMSGRIPMNVSVSTACPQVGNTGVIHKWKPKRASRSYYKAFDEPIKIEYDPRDQDGILPINTAIYLVVCSDIDLSQLSGPNEAQQSPRISIVSKVYYFEP